MVVDIMHTMTHSHLMCLYEYENIMKSEKNACFFLYRENIKCVMKHDTVG